MKRTLIFISFILLLTITFFGQAKNRTTKKTPQKKTATATAETPSPTPEREIVSETPTPTPAKKNERPNEATPRQTEAKEAKPDDLNEQQKQNGQTTYPYVYEFSQPNFVVSHIVIEHDESGKGTITFEKKESSGEPITDPILLTPRTLTRIKALFETLNFLTSTEDYQSPVRDYGHLGNYTVTLRKDRLHRTAKYNWTENKDAKALVDEYRKIGEQFIWYFDMNISRENQPLEAPSLMERLDSLLKRNEISDPTQMLPYLRDLTNDERIPLIARNRAAKIVKEIEKNRSKMNGK